MQRFKFGWLASFALAGGQLGCGTGPQTDNDLPSVVITSPANGATVSGAVIFSADAFDSFGIDEVRFFIDGFQVLEDRLAPYATTWNTLGGTTVGSHLLKVEAQDLSGNTASAAVTVTVSNSKQ